MTHYLVERISCLAVNLIIADPFLGMVTSVVTMRLLKDEEDSKFLAP